MCQKPLSFPEKSSGYVLTYFYKLDEFFNLSNAFRSFFFFLPILVFSPNVRNSEARGVFPPVTAPTFVVFRRFFFFLADS